MSTKGDDSFRALRGRLADLLPRLNERDRRVAMAAEVKSWDRVRALGDGRKKAEVTDSELVDALDALVEPETRGTLSHRCGGP